ncbi:sodium-dependent transporter [Bacillus marinisedimentorum]|uniref:sodium-dependent transporter n=1 Tax=Bacillus marinisedimentorum TaxID=1821260 RepID=UPI000872DE30|nr:sodium-dependent transporter [Bacillus marinisedimentorum]
MKKHEQWTSKLGFILAAAGSAIGLGAIWKFPYMTGANGGGAFLLLFLLFTVLIGAPMLLAEFIIGRNTQKDAVSSYRSIDPDGKWHYIGYIGILTSLLILSFYSVAGGWILSYLIRALTGSTAGLTSSEYDALFGTIISNPAESLTAQFIFLALTVFVVAGGIKDGIEKASKLMMPSLFILFIILAVRSLTLDGAAEGLNFFLMPDWNDVSGETAIMALGQAFFALSVGVSVMVTYSSYLGKNESLTRSVTSVVSMNILISLLAGLVIFPAVFTFGFEPGEGPGLVFVVLPAVFNELAFGNIFFLLFLVLLLFATLTSAFSILEILVSAVAKNDRAKRKKWAWLGGLIVFIAGIPSNLSNGVLADVMIFGKTVFDLIDYITSNILLPTGGLLIALFIAFKMKKPVLEQEFHAGNARPMDWTFTVWYMLIRFVVPAAIVLIFLNVLGVF